MKSIKKIDSGCGGYSYYDDKIMKMDGVCGCGDDDCKIDGSCCGNKDYMMDGKKSKRKSRKRRSDGKKSKRKSRKRRSDGKKSKRKSRKRRSDGKKSKRKSRKRRNDGVEKGKGYGSCGCWPKIWPVEKK